MKILHIIPRMYLGCGTSVSAFSAIVAMKERGHDIFTVAEDYDSFYLKKLEKYGITYFFAPLSQYKKNLVNFLKAAKIISDILRKGKITIVHSHHRWNALIGTLSARLNFVTSITSDHSILHGKKTLSFLCDGIITDSVLNKSHLINYFGVPEKRIRIVPPLIGKDRYEQLIADRGNDGNNYNRYAQFKRKGEFLIGQIARLSKEKGLDFFIEAIKRVVMRMKNVRFLVLGDGPFKTQFLHELKINGLHDYVHLLGKTENPLDFLKALDLYIVTSSREGFCIAAAEAILSGLPIIATKVGGLPEHIKDGETGFLVEYGDLQSLVDKIIFLLSHPEQMKFMGERGREYFLTKYSYELISTKLEEAYSYFKNLRH